MSVHPFPRAVSPRPARDLILARRVAEAVAQGEAQSLPVLIAARDRLETHGVAEDSAALLQIEAAAMLARMRARKPAPQPGMIRGELARFAVLLAFGAAVLVVGLAL